MEEIKELSERVSRLEKESRHVSRQIEMLVYQLSQDGNLIQKHELLLELIKNERHEPPRFNSQSE